MGGDAVGPGGGRNRQVWMDSGPSKDVGTGLLGVITGKISQGPFPLRQTVTLPGAIAIPVSLC